VEDVKKVATSDDHNGGLEPAEIAPGTDLPDPPVEPVLSPVRFNAAKHGILSVSPALPAFEREEDWLAFRDSVFEGIAPLGGLEMALAEEVASILWRRMRVRRYERECTAASQLEAGTDLVVESLMRRREMPRELTPEVKAQLDRQAMRRLLPTGSTLDNVIRYQGMLRRELAQALRHLESLQRERKKSAEMAMVRDVFRGFGPLSGRSARGQDDLLGDGG